MTSHSFRTAGSFAVVLTLLFGGEALARTPTLAGTYIFSESQLCNSSHVDTTSNPIDGDVASLNFFGDRLAGSIGTFTFSNGDFTVSASRVKAAGTGTPNTTFPPTSVTATGTYVISGSMLTLTPSAASSGGEIESTDNTIVFGGVNSLGIASRARFIGGFYENEGYPCVDTFSLDRK